MKSKGDVLTSKSPLAKRFPGGNPVLGCAGVGVCPVVLFVDERRKKLVMQ